MYLKKVCPQGLLAAFEVQTNSPCRTPRSTGYLD
jgi:hypothetical protein